MTGPNVSALIMSHYLRLVEVPLHADRRCRAEITKFAGILNRWWNGFPGDFLKAESCKELVSSCRE